MYDEPDEYEGAPDVEIDVVTCPHCGHPNLEIRSHCRRCGARLLGSANLVPGVELLEWAATDGASRRHTQGLPPRMLLLVAAAVFVPLLIARFRFAILAHPVPAAAIAGLAVGLAIIYGRSRRRSLDEAAASASDGSEDARGADDGFPPGPPCPDCGAPTSAIDDICVECGAVVASDLRP